MIGKTLVFEGGYLRCEQINIEHSRLGLRDVEILFRGAFTDEGFARFSANFKDGCDRAEVVTPSLPPAIPALPSS